MFRAIHPRLMAIVSAIACVLAAQPSAAQSSSSTGTGVISGIVIDATASTPLPGATISIEGTSLVTAAGRDGRFQLAGVPAGDQELVATYLGHETASSVVRVVAGQVLPVEVLLRETLIVREEITVAAPIQEGQARALNQQRTAPNIMNVISSDQIGQFPDSNAAEATQRVPGVTIERDQGEGRYVVVRGTEARLNSMMINGERIPSPEGDVRAVALDVVPTDLLEAIEVSKALTSDMDADAIGGSVNLITKTAPAQPRVFGTVAGGYNSLMEDWAQGTFNGTAGRRFVNNKLGVIITASASDVNRGSDNFEAEYDDGDLAALNLRDYTINRERYGLNGALDYRLSPGNTWNLRGIYNSFADQEFRRGITHIVEDGEIEWELKDRLETQIISSLATSGQHLLGNGMMFDYAASFSYAEEDEPGAYYTIFKQEDVEFDPNVSPDGIDPENIQSNPANFDVNEAFFDQQAIEDNLTSDRDAVIGANLRMPFAMSANASGSLKFGAKFRDKSKTRDASTVEFGTDDDIAMASILDPDFDPLNFLEGRYDFGPYFSPTGARALNNRPDFESEIDDEVAKEDYDATESVAAAYVMADLVVGPRLTILPGVRIERTSIDYTGYDLLFNDEGDFEGISPVSDTDSYAHVLPAMHMRYAWTADSNVRAAITRSLARPNYYDLVPYQVVFQEDLEIERGNPELRPSTSWNFDLMAERYFQSVGIVSAGVFYKSIDDFIFSSRYEEDLDGDSFDVTQPLNGPRASVTGVELAVQNQLRFLPAPLNGLGVYANYTYATSSADVPEREADDLNLIGQVRHSGNLSLWYERGGFSSRMAMTFRDGFLSEVGGDAAEDLFVDSHHQLDLSVSQAVTPAIRVFADVLNLTNQPLRVFEGTETRPVQEEYYRWWATFGVRFGF